tara:strand:- start:584 stop:760 length:177 start_codon:yes stop_codon:yes gene_type:complete
MTGEQFKKWRAAMGYKDQKEAAAALDIHWKTVSNYERGFAPIPRRIELATKYLTTVAA